MSCCAAGVEGVAEAASERAHELSEENLQQAVIALGSDQFSLELAVPDMHCAACIQNIERGVAQVDGVSDARVNLSTKRVRITFGADVPSLGSLAAPISKLGYRVFLLDQSKETKDEKISQLVRAMAVAGFAAGNIMLFSVSVWSGAEGTTRQLFHWISALIAIPTVLYSGQEFFRSALLSMRAGQLNMDVPISLAVILALGVSLFETFINSEFVYFDAAVTLLFFLLIGRTLDHVMRNKARSAITNLTRMQPQNATRIFPDGSRQSVAISALQPGMLISVAPGERLGIDGRINAGISEVDMSLTNGESMPKKVEPGSEISAGIVNLTGPLEVEILRSAKQSFLTQMIDLMAAAENGRAKFRRIADRASQIYVPVVHLLALATFSGWIAFSGDMHHAVLQAVAVLIITCPCALALAVPMTHIVASGRLFQLGVLMRDSVGLENLGHVSCVVFDKTGSLTIGVPELQNTFLGDLKDCALAGSIAAHSHHPYSRALTQKFGEENRFEGEVREVAGYGLEAQKGETTWRLGRAEWALEDLTKIDRPEAQVWLSKGGAPIAAFSFDDPLREGAKSCVADLQSRGIAVKILSGDRRAVVCSIAEKLGIEHAHAQLTPEEKVAFIQEMKASGERVLMVGDGINDAPALRAADVSMAPASATDIGKKAADFVFLHGNLEIIPKVIKLAQSTDLVVKQNLSLAVIYNCIAVPLAIFGFVTPLVAAIAMSASSLVVTLSALRLRFTANGFQRLLKPFKWRANVGKKISA